MTTTSPGAVPLVAALSLAAPPQVEVVVPVFNEQAGLAASVRRLHAHLQDAPYSWRVTIADNASTDGTLAVARAAGRDPARRARRAPAREGPRPRPRAGVVGQRRAGAGVHGRRPVDRPERAAAAGRAAAVRAQRPRHRVAARPQRPGRPRPEAGADHAAATTCCCTARCGCASATRSAGSRRSAPTAPGSFCRTSRTPGGSSTPSCSSWPSGPACGSPRCRSTGSTTRTPGSTSSRRRWPTCAAWPGWPAAWPAATSRSTSCAARCAASRRRPR